MEDSNIVFAGEWILRIQNSFIWTSSGVITPCLCDAFASYGYQVFSRHENKGNLNITSQSLLERKIIQEKEKIILIYFS